MLYQKNKFILNIIFLTIFLISIVYTTIIYLKGDNVIISKTSFTPVEIIFYSPSNDEIGVSMLSSLSPKESYLTIIEKLFLGDTNIDYTSSDNKLSSSGLKSKKINFNYYGDIKKINLDYDSFDYYLWQNYKKIFYFEVDAYQNKLLIQKNNYNKIIKDFKKNESIYELTDYDITSCNFKLLLEDFDAQSFVSKEHRLDYECRIGISKKYEKNKDTFFKLFNYEVFIGDNISDVISTRSYNKNYIIYSFIAFISFFFLLLINFFKKNK